MTEEKKKLVGKCLRYSAEVLIIFAAFFGVTTLAASCGSLTKASIRQIRPNATVSVTISTNNPTDMNISPNTNLKHEQSTLPKEQ